MSPWLTRIIIEMTKEIDDKTLAAREELAGHYKQILGLLGEDAEREGLIKTPERVAKAMQFFNQRIQRRSCKGTCFRYVSGRGLQADGYCKRY